MALGKDENSNGRNISEIRVGKCKTTARNEGNNLHLKDKGWLKRRHEILKLLVEYK